LTQNNIDFEDINVAADREKAKEMIQKTGQRGVPVVDIDGSIVVGFDKQAIDELLNL
jgi:glutaredoxin 3